MPQTEIMMADLPHVSYRRRKGGGGGRPAPVSADDPAFRLQREANDRVRMRRMTEDGVTVEELFAGKGR